MPLINSESAYEQGDNHGIELRWCTKQKCPTRISRMQEHIKNTLIPTLKKIRFIPNHMLGRENGDGKLTYR
jgi:hypothetical protein